MKILISTDTSCLVNNEMLKKYDISVFPLNVIIDGEEFLDGVTISQPELLSAMRGGKSIKTSTPPLGSVIEYFENLFSKGYDHIIHFTISSKLSSMNSLFTSVAEQNFKGKLTVIDSYALSSVMLSYVLTAYEDAKLGLSPEDIAKKIEGLKASNLIFFIPENLTTLKNGGRISPAIALIGNAIGIKPVLLLKDGEIQKSEMTRKVRLALTEKIDAIKNDFPETEFDYFVINFGADEYLLNYVQDYAKETLGESSLVFGNIPINVSAHCGPGTVGVVVSHKINGQSAKNYF